MMFIVFFSKKAQAAAAKTYEFKKDFSVNETENSFDYQGQENIEDIRLAMPGKHQISNASLAITAALLLSKKRIQKSPKKLSNLAWHRHIGLGEQSLCFQM